MENNEELVKTELTSIATEEVKSNKEFFVKGEGLANGLAKGFPILLLKLQNTIKKAKAKQITPAIIAALDLPKEGLDVKWIDPATKKPRPEFETTVEIFRLTQELITARLVIAQQDWLKVVRPMLEQELKHKLEQLQTNGEENNE